MATDKQIAYINRLVKETNGYSYLPNHNIAHVETMSTREASQLIEALLEEKANPTPEATEETPEAPAEIEALIAKGGRAVQNAFGEYTRVSFSANIAAEALGYGKTNGLVYYWVGKGWEASIHSNSGLTADEAINYFKNL